VHKSCNNATKKNVQDPIDCKKDYVNEINPNFLSKEEPRPDCGKNKQNSDMVSNHRLINR
jgi:hypothetical protein